MFTAAGWAMSSCSLLFEMLLWVTVKPIPPRKGQTDLGICSEFVLFLNYPEIKVGNMLCVTSLCPILLLVVDSSFMDLI